MVAITFILSIRSYCFYFRDFGKNKYSENPSLWSAEDVKQNLSKMESKIQFDEWKIKKSYSWQNDK